TSLRNAGGSPRDRQRVRIQTRIGKRRRISDGVALAFVSDKEESSVRLERSTEGSAEFLQVDLLLLVSRKERIPRVRPVCASKKIAGAVPCIGTGFQRHTRDRTGLPTKFRFRILLCRELLNGVDCQKGSRIAGETDRIDCALA